MTVPTLAQIAPAEPHPISYVLPNQHLVAPNAASTGIALDSPETKAKLQINWGKYDPKERCQKKQSRNAVERAILLSDEVIVMAGRPGTITSKLPIDLPRPRLLEYQGLPEFQEFASRIREAIGGSVTKIKPYNQSAELVWDIDLSIWFTLLPRRESPWIPVVTASVCIHSG